MKKFLVIAIITLISFFSLWIWQAYYAQNLLMIPVPDWIIGNHNSYVCYTVAIGKSQIHPLGTIWKVTYIPSSYNNWLTIGYDKNL